MYQAKFWRQICVPVFLESALNQKTLSANTCGLRYFIATKLFSDFSPISALRKECWFNATNEGRLRFWKRPILHLDLLIADIKRIVIKVLLLDPTTTTKKKTDRQRRKELCYKIRSLPHLSWVGPGAVLCHFITLCSALRICLLNRNVIRQESSVFVIYPAEGLTN